MVDVKVCSKCGVSISSHEIIGGQAKLVGGQLFCGACAATARTPAPASSAAPARPQASATAAVAAKPPAPPPVLPPKDEPLALPPDEPGDPSTADQPLALEESGEEASEIQVFRGKAGATRQAQIFKRDPKSNGTGAVRVRSFDSKLTRSALQVMDEQINAWLDETGYEVKFVTTTIGDIQGKVTESHLILNLWY
jgi:hypothetical protein